MPNQLIARGQVTIHTQTDSYTITQSIGEYIFNADNAGKITALAEFVSTVKVAQGDKDFTNFTIGTIVKPVGFASITVNNTLKTITYKVNANTANLADSGAVIIPILINGTTYNLGFSWSKAKAGVEGPSVIANLPEWIEEWDSGKTQINANYVITPKLFAGVKNANGTITGTAIGRFAIQTRNAAGTIVTETVDGIYGFRDGYKTFMIDNGGNVEFGRGDQSIKYDAVTGKIEFGSDVSMQWIGATYIDANGIFTGTLSATTVNAIKLNASQIAAGTISADRIDVNTLKAQLITAQNIEALTLNVTKGKIGGWSLDADSIYRGTKNNTSGAFTASSGSITIGSNGIRGFKWALDSTGAGKLAGGNIAWDAAGNVTFGASVKLIWGTEINNALNSAKLYTDQKGEELNELALAMAFGKMIHRDPTFSLGMNGAILYDNSKLGNVKVERAQNTSAPNDSKYVLKVTNTGEASPGGCGGFYLNTKMAANKVFVSRIIAKIPIGYKLTMIFNSIGTGGSGKWLTSVDGTGKWTEYVHKTSCGTDGVGNCTDYIYLTGASGSSDKPLVWEVAYATSFDVTSAEKYTTTIDANGIYTGTLTANQINAVDINASSIKTGFLSADRIAAGSIKADKLDAASIKAGIINADYINGLTLKFERGQIGGWSIDATSIYYGTLGAVGATPIRIRAVSSGSGYWYTGAYKPYGIALTWYQTSNAGHLVFGQVAASGSTVKTGFMGLQMMSWDSQEYFCLSANTTKTGAKEVYNRIAGWAFDYQKIWKNNVSLGADGSIINGTKWKLNNDGSGQVANGNISWNAAGAVSFSESVSLNWINAIHDSKTTNYGYPYYKKIVINGESNKYYPVIIKGGDQTVLRDILIRRSYNEQAPNDWNTSIHKAGLVLLMKANFGGWDGVEYFWNIYELAEKYSNTFAGATHCGNGAMFAIFLRGGGTTGAVYNLYSNQPLDSLAYSPSPVSQEAPQIAYNSDLIFVSGSTQQYAPAPRTYTEAVKEEIRKKRFIQLSESNDKYLGDHPLTYIGATGIYTGTLTANQVNAVAINASSITTGTLNVARLAAGSIKAEKLDVADIQAGIVTATHINGLTLNFVRGKIGGFTIDAASITSTGIASVGATPIQIRSSATGSGNWFNGQYRPYGISMLWYQSSNAGHIVFGQVAASGNSVKTGFVGLQMMSWDNQEYFCLSANSQRSGAKEVYNRIAGWAFDHQSIYKNSVYLGSDGSIYNGTKWKLNNDGSGQVANGNISWNAAGAVTFASSVSANWTTGINTANDLARAMAFGQMLYRHPEFRYNGSVHYNGTNNYLTNATRSIVGISGCPNSTGYALRYIATAWNTPTDKRIGGFCFSNKSRANAVFIVRIIANIPVGRNIQNAHNSYGTGGTQKWLTSQAGTGKWEEYICKVTCGSSGIFSTINHFSLSGGDEPTESSPVIWYIAYATVFDVTSSEKYMTTIDANGIYSGTVKANQIIVDSSLIVGGASGSTSYEGSVLVRNASNTAVVTLDRTGITAISGRIGGWTLTSYSLYAGSVYLNSSGNIRNGTLWQLNNDGSGRLANGKIVWDSTGNLTLENAIAKNLTITGTIRNAFVKYDSSIWIEIGGSGSSSNQQINAEKYDNICVFGGQDSGGWNLPNPSIPWTINQSGRRLCLIHYRYNNEYAYGVNKITAPSGKYFFENGQQVSVLEMSREVVELIGYGTPSTFYGWIVLNRRDMMTTSTYGGNMKFLAMGTVTWTSATAATHKYKTFDGSDMPKPYRRQKGIYDIDFPSKWNLSPGKYVVYLTGLWSEVENKLTTASVKSYSNTFVTLQTQEGTTLREGAYNYIIVSAADFSTNYRS